MTSVNPIQNLQSENLGSLLSAQENPASKVLIYADGSCLKNGSEFAQAGAGVVLMTEDRRRIKLKACYLGALTNQKAEIQGRRGRFGIAQSPCPSANFFRLEIRCRNDVGEKPDETKS